MTRRRGGLVFPHETGRGVSACFDLDLASVQVIVNGGVKTGHAAA
jgi:hypothetical protein